MARLAAALVLALVVGATPAGALSGPGGHPAHHAPAKHHRRPARKPARKPVRVPVAAPGTAPGTTAIVAPPAAPVDGSPAAPPADDPAPVDPPPAALSHALGVTAKEFSLGLTRTILGAGVVTIELRNAGEDPHDLRIDRLDGTEVAGWDELQAGDPPLAKSLTLTPGSYRVYCTLPAHADLGMDTRVTVRAG